MAHERLRPQFLFDEEKIKQLRQIAPECFEDGKINFETLRQNLGDWAQDEEDKDLEHFGLFWPGKREARRAASIPSQGTLEPVYGEGLKTDGTPDTDGLNDSKNIFIEGENLEVLKILQKSYAGKIKMIYIDPPYNTGNDFVYDDDFTEPLQEYLRRTGQIDEEGKPLTTNKRSDGRFHSKWLSMMYPRLRLAKNLLSDDGIIFISINDNEVHNLRSLMNEVFGEENFIAQLIWNSEGNTDNQLEIKINHEYILTYVKDVVNKSKAIGRVVDPNTREDSNLWKGFADNNINKNSPANPPTVIELPVGFPSVEKSLFYQKKDLDDAFFQQTKKEKYISEAIKAKYKIEAKSGLPVKLDDLVVENFKLTQPCRIYGGFANSEKLRTFIDSGFQTIADDDGSPIKFYLNKNAAVRYNKEVEQPSNILSVLKNFGTTEKSKTELKKMGVYFSYPKPVGLLKYLISIGAEGEDSIILDFFAGSGTLAQAVMETNAESGSNKAFICVQFPEACNEDSEAYKAGFKTISEVSKERIRKTFESKKYQREGMSVFKLRGTNYKVWKKFEGASSSDLERQLDAFSHLPLVDGFSQTSLLTEVILLEGFSLSSHKSVLKHKHNTIFQILDKDCEHSLLICLDSKIDAETIKSLALSGNDIFICFDNAISNVDKLRLSDRGLIKTI